MKIVGRDTPLNHYQWGEQCDTWTMADNKGLSVKLERMPAATAEQRHYHSMSQQFFYVLKGEAYFEVGQQSVTLHSDQGLLVEPGQIHRIANRSAKDLEFLLVTQPAQGNDRINAD